MSVISLELALLSGDAPREVRWLGMLGQQVVWPILQRAPALPDDARGLFVCRHDGHSEDPTIRIYDLAQLRVAGEGMLCHVLALKLCCSDLRCSKYSVLTIRFCAGLLMVDVVVHPPEQDCAGAGCVWLQAEVDLDRPGLVPVSSRMGREGGW